MEIKQKIDNLLKKRREIDKQISQLKYLFNMEKIKIGDITYKLNIEKAKELGLLEEESTFKISTDYKTGAIVISE